MFFSFSLKVSSLNKFYDTIRKQGQTVNSSEGIDKGSRQTERQRQWIKNKEREEKREEEIWSVGPK